MIDFKSSLLKPMPKEQKRQRHRFVRPGYLLLASLFLIGIPIFIILTKTLPRDGFGYALYWFHDHIFLPIKGYTYELFFPISLVFWVPILLLLLLWLVSYLWSIPIFKKLQIYLARGAVKKYSIHPILTGTSRLLNKWGLEPKLLTEITAEQHKIAVNRLLSHHISQTTPHTETGDSKTYISQVLTPAVQITLLYTRLITLPPCRSRCRLEALVCLQEVHMRLKPYVKGDKTDELLQKPAARFISALEESLVALLPYEEKRRVSAALSKKAGFDIETIALDLYYLLALSSEPIAGTLLGAEVPIVKRREIIIRRLAESTSARRAFLDDALMELEVSDRYEGLYVTGDNINLGILGRLAMFIALELAVLTGSSDVGLGFIETVEAMDFVMTQWLGGQGVTGEAVGVRKFVLLLEQVPAPGDYRFIAQLAEKEMHEQKKAWRRVASGKEDLVRDGDFKLVESRVRALYHAAGPVST
ncbi:MAG: hypothetical protein GY765_19980 [bacterium]|nr:hypothetical protein [bacterium]